MKSKMAGWIGVAMMMTGLVSGFAQDPPAAAPVTVSPAAAAVVSMAEAGQGDDAQLAYVQSSQSPFNLSADDVIYLRDVGLSSAVITAMLNHDKGAPAAPTQPAPQYNYNQQPYAPGGQPPAADVPPPVAAQDAPPPAYVSDAPADVSYFYNSLQPYGAWVNLDGYGWCWQPRTVVINHGWRPYCDGGHWVYTDAGWFWQSDYSWGWAAFHYGRWQLHPRNGWVWFPDRVWAPAWVSWRQTDGYCGWAPLPWHSDFVAGSGFRFNGVSVGVGFDFGLRADLFTFVGLGDFGGRDYVHHRVAPVEVNRFYNRTTIINNYTADKNHGIINHGIPVERVTAVTHKEIRPVSIRTAPSGENFKPSANMVYRREVQAPARPVKVVAQKVDDRHPTIQHAPVVTAPVRVPPNRPTPPTGTQVYQPGRTQGNTVTTPVRPTIEPGPSRAPTYPAAPTHSTQVSPPPTYQHTTPVSEPSMHATQFPKPVERTFTPTLNPAPKPPAPLQSYSTPQSQQQNTHVYNPKSVEQASSAHTLPPLNQSAYANGHGQSGGTSSAPLQSPKSSGGPGPAPAPGQGPGQGQGQGGRQPH